MSVFASVCFIQLIMSGKLCIVERDNNISLSREIIDNFVRDDLCRRLHHDKPPRDACVDDFDIIEFKRGNVNDRFIDRIKLVRWCGCLFRRTNRAHVDFSHKQFQCSKCFGNCVRRRRCCRERNKKCKLLSASKFLVRFMCATKKSTKVLINMCEKQIDENVAFGKQTWRFSPTRGLVFKWKNNCLQRNDRFLATFDDFGATSERWSRLF